MSDLSKNASETGFTRRGFLATTAVAAALGSQKLLSESASAKSRQPAMYDTTENTQNVRAPVVTPPLAVVVANRIGYGPTPDSVADFNALGGNDLARLTAYVDQQLNPAIITDTDIENRLADPSFKTLDKTLTELWTEHYLPDGLPWVDRIRPTTETEVATFMRAAYSKRQLQERMVEFWRDHFNIYADDTPIVCVLMHYDRDVIRPNVLGNFRTMLEAVAKSPAMLYYLDNASSRAPSPNENYARELMELHTLGDENYLGVMDPGSVPIDGNGVVTGFVEADVIEVARCLTGWSIANGHWSDNTDPDTGVFRYRDFWHDQAAKAVLGDVIPANQAPEKDGLDVLDKLASHPGTAHFICKKLCRRFIADDPPESLVQSAAVIFQANWQAADQIKQVMRHILLSLEFQSTWDEKVKRPFDNIVGALRACEADYTLLPVLSSGSETNTFYWLYRATGHFPYGWVPPNGYPDSAVIWRGSTPIVMSWRMINWLFRLGEVDGDPNAVRALDVLGATLTAFPNVADRTPNNLAAFWCQRILGYVPAAEQVAVIAGMLAHSDSYQGQWDLNTAVDLTVDVWPHYWQAGLRTMIGTIFMTPEYLKL